MYNIKFQYYSILFSKIKFMFFIVSFKSLGEFKYIL